MDAYIARYEAVWPPLPERLRRGVESCGGSVELVLVWDPLYREAS